MSNFDVVVFEKLVRPFQSKDVTPGKVVVTSDGAADQPPTVTLIFGANGSGKTMNGSTNFTKTKYMDKTPREKLGGGAVIDITFPQIRFANGLLVQG